MTQHNSKAQPRLAVLAAVTFALCAVLPICRSVSAQSDDHQAVGIEHGQTAQSAAGPLFRFTEKPGPYAVGLKVAEQYDFSRTYLPRVDALGKPTVGERARPLQTLIWYPSDKSAKKPMTVRDYSALLATETSFDKPKLWGEWKSWINGMKPTLNDSLWAVRDSTAVNEKFPLVIYAPSFSAMSWENVDLCEYLASHGYVVVASTDFGATAR